MSPPATEIVGNVRHARETQYVLELRDSTGDVLSIAFDPREDGPNVYSNADAWTDPPGKKIDPDVREALLDAAARALDGYFARDRWTLWTATWPRFPLRWKGDHDHLVLLEGTERLLYGEPGRAIVLAVRMLEPRVPGLPRVELVVPRTPRWSYPKTAGRIPAATWRRIVERIRAAPGIDVL